MKIVTRAFLGLGRFGVDCRGWLCDLLSRGGDYIQDRCCLRFKGCYDRGILSVGLLSGWQAVAIQILVARGQEGLVKLLPGAD